ncbi:shufflon system plasmid conjugative transfer pilus tip adhesin PilV [Yersinia ruckeri]|uniref:shufflon system plasmid conjugative transfer pilus tip adhesin PilV n=1 Tax=Yersinia ruckeri TaxID=29486 RepID=UPI001F35AA51|nr:shufflon system plasmid conjugative transfer pilus tip adhesin PilV [Yersinia ruckeri]EKN3347713.1 shufflon system plasmid conjugative transfer pilus tip adhesin PilV [Yersinia ruckeri]EKN4700101.1 shufflon system plasmid conjugative transfer pilus tip adhesin PilV [Yersinia ruckeri]ELM3741060.1 shufflon system plasmid conjugative transfer pilus tip adhesin PilV [Yersinia ruckeri]ELM3747827.1 shufflon system plasmid conjugative transfer pilus tip adhesin PilV [Yersinia ruckeri]MCW6550182.1 
MLSKKKSFSHPPVNRGLTIAETIMVITLLSVIMAYSIPRVIEYNQERAWDISATVLSAVSASANRYIKDNKDTLTTQLKTAKNVVITGKQLQDAKYLPPGFSLTTDDGQSYLVAITQDGKSNLMAFVLTSAGKEIQPNGLRYIAQNISGLGGYIWPANQAIGANGSWTVNLSDYGLSGQMGRLAVMLSSDSLGSDSEAGDRLYRFKVNGRPDLNKMHTDIDMGNNSLNNTSAVNAQTVTVENDIKSNSGWIITQNDKGWLNATHGGGLTMTDDDWVRSVNNKGIYTGGQLRGGTIHAEGRLATDEFLQLNKIMVPGQSCEAGILTRDAEGAPLYCQAGILTGIGGGGMSRVAVNNLDIVSNGSYKVLLVTVSSLFNAGDGSHTGSASFNVYVDGGLVGVVKTSVRVDKGGSSGHYWGYQNYGVTQKQIAVNVKSNSRVTVMLAGSSYHNTSDVRIDLTS